MASQNDLVVILWLSIGLPGQSKGMLFSQKRIQPGRYQYRPVTVMNCKTAMERIRSVEIVRR